MREEEPRPLTRRAYIVDLAATGAVLLGSALWGMASGRGDVAATPTPAENDHVVPAGGSPAVIPTPTPPPPEGDHQRAAGEIPPPPREQAHTMMPGKIAVPRQPPRPAPRRSTGPH